MTMTVSQALFLSDGFHIFCRLLVKYFVEYFLVGFVLFVNFFYFYFFFLSLESQLAFVLSLLDSS